MRQCFGVDLNHKLKARRTSVDLRSDMAYPCRSYSFTRTEIFMAKFYFIKSWMVALVLALSSGLIPASNTTASADILIYSDSLLTGWENWSWNTGLNFSSTSPVHSGSYSLSV